MKKKIVTLLMASVLTVMCATGCGNGNQDAADNKVNADTQATQTEEVNEDQKMADEVADLIDAIYVQERTDETDAQCEAAKAAWDKLTDAQKALVEGENADPYYFGRRMILVIRMISERMRFLL